MRPLMLRIAGFSGGPILSALAPFLLLPVISRIVGDEGWANFSAGQSIGILAMVAVLFGWGIVGPVRVARSTSEAERASIFRESLRSRALLALVAVPIAAAVTFFVSGPSFRAESVAMTVAMAISGLTPAWFCIGKGDPLGLMVFDALPKLAASLVALPVILLGGPIMLYPVLLFAFCLLMYTLHARRTLAAAPPEEQEARGLGTILRSLVPTAAIDATGNAYGSTAQPIATVGLEATEASQFTSADRAYRIAILLVVAVANAFQAWVLTPGAADVRARQRFAVLAHLGLGVIGGAGIAVLGPWATTLVFGKPAGAVPCLLFGVAFLCISTATPLIRNLLIPAGRTRTVFAASVTAAIVGLSVMLTGSALGSSGLVAIGVAASELAALVVLAGPALRAYRALPMP